ncbi:MAG TPA: amidohydrolase, partial [Acidimicrobiales bacterium]|nr:amidohydrolase [Acidimicrobiales bacterium]
MTTVPTNEWLISVDDHVIEPPHVWTDRLSAADRERGPHMRDSVWYYEDKVVATAGLSVTIGRRKEEFSLDPVAFEDMAPGAYDPVARVADMDRAGILASLSFPSFPRFCGQ